MHTYPHPITGKPLLSVTSILEETMPEDQKANLMQWYANNPQSHFKNAESQRRGSQVDEWAKAYIRGLPLPEIDFRFQPYCSQLALHLDSLRLVADSLLIDEFIFTDDYAGTLDIAFCFEGSFTVVEVKSKDRISPASIASAKLQAIAYRKALQCRGYQVGAIVVLVGTPKKSEVFRVADLLELQQLEEQWEHRLRLAKGIYVS